MMAMPRKAPAGCHTALHPAYDAYSAPAMKVPDPIHVQTSVKTILVSERLRPATMKSSWFLICRDR